MVEATPSFGSSLVEFAGANGIFTIPVTLNTPLPAPLPQFQTATGVPLELLTTGRSRITFGNTAVHELPPLDSYITLPFKFGARPGPDTLSPDYAADLAARSSFHTRLAPMQAIADEVTADIAAAISDGLDRNIFIAGKAREAAAAEQTADSLLRSAFYLMCLEQGAADEHPLKDTDTFFQIFSDLEHAARILYSAQKRYVEGAVANELAAELHDFYFGLSDARGPLKGLTQLRRTTTHRSAGLCWFLALDGISNPDDLEEVLFRGVRAAHRASEKSEELQYLFFSKATAVFSQIPGREEDASLYAVRAALAVLQKDTLEEADYNNIFQSLLIAYMRWTLSPGLAERAEGVRLTMEEAGRRAGRVSDGFMF
jgi:hypothetical protein